MIGVVKIKVSPPHDIENNESSKVNENENENENENKICPWTKNSQTSCIICLLATSIMVIMSIRYIINDVN